MYICVYICVYILYQRDAHGLWYIPLNGVTHGDSLSTTMVLHEAVMTWKRFPLNWEQTVAQIIELTEIRDAHVTPLQWTYFLRNISFSVPDGLSDRI